MATVLLIPFLQINPEQHYSPQLRKSRLQMTCFLLPLFEKRWPLLWGRGFFHVAIVLLIPFLQINPEWYDGEIFSVAYFDSPGGYCSF